MKLEESAFGSSDENKLGQIQYKWHINSTALYKVFLFVCVCVKEGDLWIFLRRLVSPRGHNSAAEGHRSKVPLVLSYILSQLGGLDCSPVVP